MSLFLLLVRSSWLRGLISMVLGALSGVASLALITQIHWALSDPGANAVRMGSLFAATCVLVIVTQVTAHGLLVRLSQSTSARLQYELTNRILSAPLQKLEDAGSHRILNALLGDVGAITGAMTGLPGVCANAMVLLCGIAYLVTLSVPVALCTLVIAAVGVASFLTGLRIAERHLRQARLDSEEVYKHFNALTQGIKELKGNNMRSIDFLYDALLPADTTMRRNLIKGLDIHGFSHNWGRLYLFIGLGLLLFVSPQLWTVTPATLTGYTLTILYLVYPLDGILGWLPAMNSATIALERITALGLLMDEADGSQIISDEPPWFESLELRAVTYGYTSPDGHGFSLGPIDMTVRAGEELFIAGGNGSGKTTLAKLLTGLYVPHEGDVLLNGQPVNDQTRGDYRQLFSTVFVEGHLFDRLLGVDPNPEELQRWVSLLGIEEKVDVATGRLETDELSRGQRKRLALLVACMEDRPIFIFDEWAAEQDPSFKDIFYRQILPELRERGKTVIAITHDDRYFSAADRVLTLVDGRLENGVKGVAA